MNLPLDFKDKMQNLLKDEYEEFIKSYEEPKAQGLRINTLKIDINSFLELAPFPLKPIPWASEGFYYNSEDRPGKHPYHEAGLYYIQEPSAMAVVSLLDPKPGDRVLDLCAAPGGKSTHIASRLQGRGLLVSNEIHPSRAKILSQNIERMGIKNCVVTNENSEKLSKKFPEFFNKIVVDAPCSGEGMFRKEQIAIDEWSLENVALCAKRQEEILENASKMLMPGGVIVYSTCTFSPEENEGTIDKFLRKHEDFEIREATMYKGFSSGRPDWINSDSESLSKTVRLWPHKIKGEGHFIAVLKRKGDISMDVDIENIKCSDKNILKHYYEFAKNALKDVPEGRFITFGENLYLLPEGMVNMDNLKVIRPGLHLGEAKKNRFEPSHALALSLKVDEVKNNVNLNSSSNDVLRYLKGESLNVNNENGWVLLSVDGYSLGWGKVVNGVLKNHYPKGLRWV